MILTDKQIELIRSFCEGWGVTFYDVNTELVDHIASIIEQETEQNPEISFDQAFINARKSFGSEGFEALIKDREKQISKQGRKAQLKFFASFFSLAEIGDDIFVHCYIFDPDLFFPFNGKVSCVSNTYPFHVFSTCLPRTVLWESGQLH